MVGVGGNWYLWVMSVDLIVFAGDWGSGWLGWVLSAFFLGGFLVGVGRGVWVGVGVWWSLGFVGAARLLAGALKGFFFVFLVGSVVFLGGWSAIFIVFFFAFCCLSFCVLFLFFLFPYDWTPL